LSFTQGDQTVDATTEQTAALIDDGEAQVELNEGDWTASIKGYRTFTIGGTDKDYLAAEGSEDFTVSVGQTNQVTVNISPLAIGAENAPLGIFTYSITLPADVSEAKLTLDSTEPINLLPADSVSTGSVERPAGIYGLVITLKKDGLSAGVSEVVYIYPGLESKAELHLSGVEFADEVFLMGTASAEDPEGVTLPYTVTAYSNATHTTDIPGATASVEMDGGMWFIKVPASFIGGSVYLKASGESVNAARYTVSDGTYEVGELKAEGKAGIHLELPVEEIVVDKTALTTAIEQANTARNGLTISADGKDQPPGTKWVTDTVMDAFNTTLNEASMVRDNVYATQAEVDSAVTTLNSATSDFTGAIGTTLNAVAPIISEQPQDASYDKNKPVGTVYYYVVVTNTTGSGHSTSIASTTSNRAAVTVTYSGVSVEFGDLPQDEDENIELTESAYFISWVANTAITFTVSGSFSSYAWNVDGRLMTDEVAATLTLHAQDYSKGTHTVTATVLKDGKTWSKRAMFRIGE
jgi:hypothetical protein